MDSNLSKKDAWQVVALADDFKTNLSPEHNVYPSILIPVIHVPLLDYLVETLIRSGVQTLFLYCSSHVDMLKEYVAKKACKNFVISLIVSDGCRSLGDALRDIDTKGWIRDHFILIRGNAFINTDLRNIMSEHLSKVKTDKGTAMTMVLRNVGSTNDSFLKDEAMLVVSDKNKKILFYDKLRHAQKKVKLELNWFLEHGEVEINTNLIDTHIYLCSPSVLPLFSDNFDFQTMGDFIRGVLMNEDTLDARFYWQQLNLDDYGLPITSWRAYHSVSCDILHRHSFPLVPDVFPTLKSFIYMTRCTYKHKTATLAKGCTLERDCILGKESALGESSTVARSVILDNTVIGQNVVVKDSCILSDIRIGNNCIVQNSVIYPSCTLDKDVRLNGCLLLPGAKIGANKEYTNSILKPGETGVIVSEMSDLDNSNDYLLYKQLEDTKGEDCSSDESSSDANSEAHSAIPDDTNMFLSEVIDSLLRGYQDKLNCENLILEINSSRYAYNVTVAEVTYNVMKAILSLPLHYLAETKTAVSNQTYQKNLSMMLNYFQPIISNYVKTEDAQDDCLRAIEDAASTTQELIPFLKYLLHLFYDRDIFAEERILKWYETEPRGEQDRVHHEVRKAVESFIRWLQEAEEDSSDNSDDD